MIYIFCAINCEASPVVDLFDLADQYVTPGGTVIRSSADGRTILAVTGMGKENMSYAAGEVFVLYPPDKGSVAFNIGICAGKDIGEIYIVDKITDNDSQKVIYPDILYDTGLKTNELVTVSRVIEDGNIEDKLYDMEGWAFAKACKRHVGCAGYCLLKIVSDTGKGSAVTEQDVLDLIGEKRDIIRSVIDIYSDGALINDEAAPSIDPEAASELFCCSETMKNQLERLIRYADAAGIDMAGIIEDMKTEGDLPSSCRKDGKEMLDELRRRIIYSKL